MGAATARQALRAATCSAALALLLAVPAFCAVPGTVAELWKWWPKGGKAAPAGAKPAYACLANAFSGGPRDKKVSSQFGEDGIIETIFDCIGTKGKYYVEFGTESCTECTTAYLRTKGWSGLLMDGGIDNPAINLHKEYMTSGNIVSLFKKHNVPYPTFDHLTVDIDLNTFWVLRAVLAGGYRPRSIAAEINRNFAPTQAYATLDMPDEYADGPGLRGPGGGTCYFGASALAYERLLRAFGYNIVAFDEAGINAFFVHGSELGVPLDHKSHTMALVTPAPGTNSMWASLHGDCSARPWVHIADSPGLADPQPYRHMRPEVLKHTTGTGGMRHFEAIKTASMLTLHQWRHHDQGAQP